MPGSAGQPFGNMSEHTLEGRDRKDLLGAHNHRTAGEEVENHNAEVARIQGFGDVEVDHKGLGGEADSCLGRNSAAGGAVDSPVGEEDSRCRHRSSGHKT